MSVIDEVKQRTDIVEVVSRYTTLTKAGRIFKGLCPFHNEKHASFFVYPEQQTWHCFGACNTGGDVFAFIMKQQDIGFGEALSELAQRAGVELPARGEQSADKERDQRLYQVNQAAAAYFHHMLLESPAAATARDYAGRRRLKEKSLADFQLGYGLNSWDALKKHLFDQGYDNALLLEAGLVIETESGDSHDRFRHKLIFPIADDKGRVCGFGGRSLDNSMPKYTNSPQTPVFDKSGMLYGLNLAKQPIRQQDLAVIVEGYLDVITAHQNGFTNVVASMGVAVTEKHIGLLKRLTKNLVFALDADAAGEEAMLRCVDYENIIDNEVKVIIMPPGKDPDEVIKNDREQWSKLLEQAMPIVDFTFDAVTAGLDLTQAGHKTLAANKLLPVIKQIKNVIRQAHYMQKLARLISVDVRTLEAALGSTATTSSRGTIKKAELESISVAAVYSPLEEYCLALLLQHPELRSYKKQIPAEYFTGSENRELFAALSAAADDEAVRDNLDESLVERLERLAAKEMPANNTEQKLVDCISRLKLLYLKGLERQREAILSSEADAGAQIDKLKEQGIEPVNQLREVFQQRSDMAHKRGSVNGTR